MQAVDLTPMDCDHYHVSDVNPLNFGNHHTSRRISKIAEFFHTTFPLWYKRIITTLNTVNGFFIVIDADK